MAVLAGIAGVMVPGMQMPDEPKNRRGDGNPVGEDDHVHGAWWDNYGFCLGAPVLDWRDGTGERELHDGGPERGDDEPQRHRGDAGRCREKVCRACGPWILVDKILQGALFISGAGRMRGNPARGLFRCVYGGWQSRMPWSRGRLRDRKIPGHTSRYSGKIAYWMYQRCCTTGIQKW